MEETTDVSKEGLYSINWHPHRRGVYVRKAECRHSAMPPFAGYAKIRGDGPMFIYEDPTTGYVYGCFEGGGGRLELVNYH